MKPLEPLSTPTLINIKSIKTNLTSGYKWPPKIILGAGILGLSFQVLANPTATPKAVKMTLKQLLLTISMCCLVATANAAPIDDANAAYRRGDYAQALKIFRPLAAQGNAEAQNTIGSMYHNGQGVTQDYQEALEWYRLSAAQGDAWGQYNIGFMYRNGQGVTQDYQEALKWFRLAVAQGEADAQNGIGLMYGNGQGVIQNYQEALKWYKLAAAQGNAAAQNNIGMMYHNGLGVAQNHQEALKWYRLSAEQGQPNAIENLKLPDMTSAATATPAAKSAFDMSKVPLVTPMPRPGASITAPSGPGYYSLWDQITDNERKVAPAHPYAPFGLIPTSSFDHDFRYLAKPDHEKDIFDPIKRIKLANDWLVSFGGNFWYRHVHETDSRLGSPLTPNNTDNTFNLVRTRLHADIWYQDKFRLFAEGIDARSFSQTLAPLAIDANHTDMLNLFADIKLATAKEGVAYVRAGRQELLYGSQRLISTLDWVNTRRTFQGVKTFWRNPKLDVDAFWVRPMNVIPSGHNNFDNWDTNRNFYGLWATYKPQRGHFADLYFLSLDNNNSGVNPGTIGTLNTGNSLVHTVGTRYIGDTNNFLYELEGMYQFGQRSGRDVSAFAIASGTGYRFATLPMNPQMWLRYDFASGTSNGGDITNTSNTFNQLFAFGHYYMGFIDRVGRQNIHDFNSQVTFHPQKWLTVITQYHRFYLANKTDALYNASGFASAQDITGQSGSHVGDEMDLRFNIHVSRHQDVLLGYSKLWAGEYLKTNKPGVSPDLFYVQYSLRF